MQTLQKLGRVNDLTFRMSRDDEVKRRDVVDEFQLGLVVYFKLMFGRAKGF